MLSGLSLAANAQNVEVTIKGIKNNKGNMPLAVFKDHDSFMDNKAVKLVRYSKAKVVNGTMTVTLDLEPGTYGLSVLDDENANNKMDKNMIGIPKEGFGFSNYYHDKMSHPQFKDFKIVVTEQKQKVEIKMRYM